MRKLNGCLSAAAFALGLTACGLNVAREPKWLAAHEPLTQLGAHECVVSHDGRLACADQSETRPAAQLGEPIAQFDANPGFARCAVLQSGRLGCWGCAFPQFESREIQDLKQARLRFLPLPPVRQITLGYTGMCALTRAGDAWCWGFRGNDENQICQGPSGDSVGTYARGITQIALSNEGVLCRLDTAHDVRCGGFHDRMLPVVLSHVKRVVAGRNHFCALTQADGVVCWGDNEYAQSAAPLKACEIEQTSLGDILSHCLVAPHRVPLPAPVVDVSAGPNHTCAVLGNGRVFCWGSDPEGALGFTSSERCPVSENGACAVEPRAVPGIYDAIRVLASKRNVRTWALLSDGSAVAWPPDKKRP